MWACTSKRFQSRVLGSFCCWLLPGAKRTFYRLKNLNLKNGNVYYLKANYILRRVSTSEEIISLINVLQTQSALLKTKRVTAGFDGFVDTIARVIKGRQGTRTSYFQTIEEFGKYVLEKKAGSFSVEVEARSVKIGGNMPILTNAIGSLEVSVNCIGALGHPDIHKIFDSLPPSCRKFSFAEPGTSTAYEYDDGKVMFGSMGELNDLGWQVVRDRIGIDVLTKTYQESDLIALVNWSEIEASGNIWRGLFNEVIKKHSKPGKQQHAFFDLSDCSKRTDEAIYEALELIRDFGQYCKVTLGMNRNEASRIYRVLFGSDAGSMVLAGEKIFSKLEIRTLVIHHSREAIALTDQGLITRPSFFVAHPKLSTGAGDNFNAGFIIGQLLDLGIPASLILAHTLSGYYITRGESPKLHDVINFLDQKTKVTNTLI